MKTFKDLKNKTSFPFDDISTEIYRKYEFVNFVILIDNPVALRVSKNGHRVWDAQGISHYIPFGWKHLSWEVKEGAPNFVK